MSEFPKHLYVTKEVDGETTFYLANEDYGEHAKINDTVTVAKYRLQREIEVSAWPTTDED